MGRDKVTDPRVVATMSRRIGAPRQAQGRTQVESNGVLDADVDSRLTSRVVDVDCVFAARVLPLTGVWRPSMLLPVVGSSLLWRWNLATGATRAPFFPSFLPLLPSNFTLVLLHHFRRPTGARGEVVVHVAVTDQARNDGLDGGSRRKLLEIRRESSNYNSREVGEGGSVLDAHLFSERRCAPETAPTRTHPRGRGSNAAAFFPFSPTPTVISPRRITCPDQESSEFGLPNRKSTWSSELGSTRASVVLPRKRLRIENTEGGTEELRRSSPVAPYLSSWVPAVAASAPVCASFQSVAFWHRACQERRGWVIEMFINLFTPSLSSLSLLHQFLATAKPCYICFSMHLIKTRGKGARRTTSQQGKPKEFRILEHGVTDSSMEARSPCDQYLPYLSFDQNWDPMQLMCLADLEFDYINPYDSAARINAVVLPEFILQGVLSLLFLLTGHWLMFLFCLPFLYYNVTM
ncbi:hypothetical protein Taro_016455 [Colocasia esculenta]|uniref:Uncharacterized protein n=1 Tax=Colocasia esculenta TaxID=4460 RepID=A0A843UQC6_COLES|nr:hypothetical protein [Colocasia esculenta]